MHVIPCWGSTVDGGSRPRANEGPYPHPLAPSRISPDCRHLQGRRARCRITCVCVHRGEKKVNKGERRQDKTRQDTTEKEKKRRQLDRIHAPRSPVSIGPDGIPKSSGALQPVPGRRPQRRPLTGPRGPPLLLEKRPSGTYLPAICPTSPARGTNQPKPAPPAALPPCHVRRQYLFILVHQGNGAAAGQQANGATGPVEAPVERRIVSNGLDS